MTAKRNVPKLRFPGFTGEWVEKKFRDLFSERREKTTVENEDVLISCAIDGMFLNSELFDHFRGSSTIGYLKIKRNDLILSAQNLHLGNANVNSRFEHGIISPAYKVYDIKGCKPDFVEAWVKKESTKNFFLAATTEGASQCRKNIQWNILYDQTLLVPENNEQEKIGNFFESIDHLIALNQRKLDHLEQKKKGLLQKLFPGKGEHVPQWRFPGFTGEWEEKKLGEITNRIRGNDGRMDLPTLTISAGSGWLNQVERFSGNIAGKEQKKYTLLKKGQLSYNHGNSKLAKYGTVFELKTYEEALVPRVYHSFETNELAFPGFIEYIFATKKPDQELRKLISSGARMDGLLNINYDDFMGIKIMIPSIREQEKIASFLECYDNLITLQRRKLDHLQTQKKALLQQLFV